MEFLAVISEVEKFRKQLDIRSPGCNQVLSKTNNLLLVLGKKVYLFKTRK